MPIQPAPNVVIANRFRLSRLLGRGGMGSVWYAMHLGLDVPCAVKFIEGEGAELPEVQARFEREAKAAAQLRSPHVVQILDHGVCDGTPYIAMELLDGEDLGKRLARVGRLPPHELLVIVTQVCRALTKAHAQGIVHRDLKPDNVFLVHDDDREIAKVLDFGIAKAAGSGVPGSGTRTGAMLGTPYYMSPEQAQGTRAVDFRSDLWSLSVMVFEALTGLRPFESEALGDLLMKIIVSPVPLPSHMVRDLPPGLDAWWSKASQRDPALRFQSARELGESLAMVFGRSGSGLADPASRFMMTPPASTLAAPGPPSPGLVRTPQPRGGASTGAPIAQTFGEAPVRARGRTGAILAVTGALVALVAGVVGVSFVVRGKTETAAGAGHLEVTSSSVRATLDAAPSELQATARAVLPSLPEPVASVSQEIPPTPAVELGAQPAVAASARTRPPPVARPQAPLARPPAAPTASAKPPVAPPAAEEKKKPIDLGI
jgi:hypothetical protein